ncbi:MAG TPA: 3-hydroxyacyl-CoA dehydrogenase NAD-binding domain-containing protein [Kofleriaceae bacterium]|jgi:3-hydroxyacyl-CoA dehydrogenase
MRSIQKVVVLGANGVMGAGAGALFASAGVPTVMLARTAEKAAAGVARANQITKGRIRPGLLSAGTYDDDLATVIADADLVLEAVAEEAATKRDVISLIDRLREPHTIVATVTSGLSIADLCAGYSSSLREHFVGIHLFNPPMAIAGCELIAHPGTDPGVLAVVREFLTSVCGRQVVECADRPAFAGNRLGFKLLNEVAQLAEEHGVAFMDRLLGPHTGRALPPLATIDLVGWDVHKAIVDNLRIRTRDTARESFKLPAYMRRGIERGTLGRKAKELGGFYRERGAIVLDPASGDYHPATPLASPLAEAMEAVLRTRGYAGAMEVMCNARGLEAEILQRVLLGYISYGLGLVGEVVARPRDVDRIMGFGFAWAPPGVLVDAIGPARAIVLLEQLELPVPAVVEQAARSGRPVFDEPAIDASRFFAVAA